MNGNETKTYQEIYSNGLIRQKKKQLWSKI